MSKKFRSIIIQTLIGGFLMWVAMWYLQNHPAEKVGIFSTFDYAYQKVTGVGKYFQGRSKVEVDDLSHFKSSFEELQSVVSSKACEKAIKAKEVSEAEISQVLGTLEDTTAEEFSTNKSKYIALFNRINEEINRYCEK